MSTEIDKAPERIWTTPAEASWRAYPLDAQRAFPATAPEQIEYVRAELLAQVEQELADEKRLRAELKQIAQIGISEVSSVGAVLKDNAVTNFRSRAIQLCKDKAADLNREVNKVDPDDDPTYFQVLAARIATANELAGELEKI